MPLNSGPVLLYDSNGLPLVLGQVVKASSLPVTIASDQWADAIARATYEQLTDGTNGPVAVKAASTAPVATDKALVVVLSPNQPAIPVSSSPATSTPGIAFGTVTTTAVTNVAVRATAYTEQSANFTGSISSNNAADAAAGTGARSIRLFWMDATGATIGTEDVTLNGTTPVNLVTATKCFIERVEALTVGSGLKNAGVISLFTGAAGAGTLVGTIAAGDNQTFWAHHYVQSGKTCSITGMTGNNNNGSNQSVLSLQHTVIPVANKVADQISDWISCGGATSQPQRVYGSLIKVTGPSRIVLFAAPAGTPSIITRGSFDFYDS
jgi:hypothetical protein